LTIVRSARFLRDGFFFRAESFFNVASEAERLGVLASYGGRSLHEQSHGESFLALLENRISDGFYVFDEPEAALSPNRQLTALRMIYDRVRAGAQFLIATHSPIMLAYPGARIVELTHQGIRQISLEESEHFRTARDFLAAPSRMLQVLLGQDD
jgi:predicted ATPase